MAVAGLAFTDCTIDELTAIIDFPPEGTALREALDGPTSKAAVQTAQIVHYLRVLIWNSRAAAGVEDEPFPEFVIPGVASETKATADWSSLDDSEDLTDLMRPEVAALLMEV